MAYNMRARGAGSSVCVAMLCALTGAALPVAASDPDVRKLTDVEPATTGPIWRLGDPTPRDGGFNASGMTCLSRIPLNNFVGVSRSSGNDCWGYVSPSGREYAIMGLEGGYGFVEITNPVNPIIVATIAGPSSLWHDIKVVGPYAYGVSEGGSGIQVIDLSNIDNGQVTLVRNWTSGGYATTHNIIANEDAGTLWLAGANIGNGGLIHISLANPTLPALAGGWTDMYVHDAQVVTWQGGALAGRQLAFCASGFDGGFTQTGLRVVDVTNPNAPQVLATLFYPNAGYAHQVWLSTDRKYLYLNDELDEGSSVSVTTTRVIDVSDPASPVLVGTYTTGLPSIDHNLYTRDGLVYQANYRSGLRVFDALNPANPVPLAFFDTYPANDDAEFNGAWSSYPFFPSGNIAVSDIERGLFVLRLDATPFPAAIDSATDLPDVIDPSGGETIDARVFQRSGSDPVVQVDLMLDAGAGFTPVAAASNGDGTYTATIPAVPCGSNPRIYWRATTLSSFQAVYPAGAPGNTIGFAVASSETVAFQDSFETNTGWTVSGPVASAASGRWERAIPAGDGSRGDPASDADGSGRCYITGNGGPGSNTDVDGGQTILTSPTLDTTGNGEAFISYARWYSNSSGAAPGEDVFTVQVSGNNGASWTTAEIVGPTGDGTGGGWIDASFRVADFVTPSTNTRVRFIAEDAINGSVVEAGVDAVRVEFLICEDAPACPADLAAPEGILNFFDISAYIASFNAQDPSADLAAPTGVFNFFDISAYITLFNQGCP